MKRNSDLKSVKFWRQMYFDASREVSRLRRELQRYKEAEEQDIRERDAWCDRQISIQASS